MSGFKRLLTAGLMLAAGAAMAQGKFGQVDEQQEIAIGAELSASLLGAAPLVNDEELQRYVNRVGLWLALQTERPHLPWTFGVLETETVNAFAAPGGYIFITKGLFAIMSDENQLAGVLAHEIGHVLKQHHLKAIQKQMMTGLVAGVAAHLLIEDDTVANAVAQIGTNLWTKGLDRQDELEADRVGVVVSTRSGYKPHGLPDMLLRLDAMNAEDPSLAFMFSTHPPTRDRIKALEVAMDGRFDGIKGFTGPSKEFVQLRQRVGGTPSAVVAGGDTDQSKVAVAAAVPAPATQTGLGSSTLSSSKDLGELIAPPQPGVTFRDQLKDGTPGPELMVVAAGSFQMGDQHGRGEARERPLHEVHIGKSFALGRTEVSFEEYDRFARATGRSLPDDQGIGRGKLPVLNVSWNDAIAYTAWLSAQTGQNYRLPSEAEWEYAARAGSKTIRSWGNSADKACQFANVGDRSLKHKMSQQNVPVSNEHACDDGHAGPAPVGTFKANAFGLNDMFGNVFEWTADCGQTSYAGAPVDGEAWVVPVCGTRISRGGSWESGPEAVRSAARVALEPDYRDARLGFRVARDL
jgi:formylglycine-generating enzyme required for sulfatase activity/Zn-dependent protease with chaperone function